MNKKLRHGGRVRMSNIHLNRVPKGQTSMNKARQWLVIFQNE